MDASYLHLAVNHFAVILGVLGAAAILLALVVRRRGLWVYATATLALAGLAAYPAKWTGERAEDAVESAWFASEDVIHEHEEAGEWATWVMMAAGALAAMAWLRTVRSTPASESTRVHWSRNPGWLRALVVVTALMSATAMVRTAWLAGFIRHRNEAIMVRPGAGAQVVPTTPLVPTR